MTWRAPQLGFVDADIASMTLEELRNAWRHEDGRIQDAYWAFTRQAKAAPPSCVVPDAYRRRHVIEERIRILRREAANV